MRLGNMRGMIPAKEVVNQLGQLQMKLHAVIEDEDYQVFFQDGKDGSSLRDQLTGLFDDITSEIKSIGLEPKGCCSEET